MSLHVSVQDDNLQRIHTYIYNVSWFSFLTLVIKKEQYNQHFAKNKLVIRQI